MCLLGVSVMNNHIYGSKVPQNPHIGGISSQICKKFKYLYLQICVPDWHEIWRAAAASNRDYGVVSYGGKQFQDGGRLPFWKLIYRHISVKNYPIFMKFCTQQQILNWVNVTWSKMKRLHWTDSEFDRTYYLFILRSESLKSQNSCRR